MNTNISQFGITLLHTVVIDLMGLGKVNLHVTVIYNRFGYIDLRNSYAKIEEIIPGSINYMGVESCHACPSGLDEKGFVIFYPDATCDIDNNHEPFNMYVGEAKRFEGTILRLSEYIQFNDKEEDKKFNLLFDLIYYLRDLNCLYYMSNLEILFQYQFAINDLFPGLRYTILMEKKRGKNCKQSLKINKPGSIYIFADTKKIRFKLGYSTNIEARRKAIASASGFDLETLHVVKKVNIEIEKRIHSMFGLLSIKGEWYPYDEGLINTMLAAIERLKESEH